MLISVAVLVGLVLAGWAVTVRDVVLLYFTAPALSAITAWIVYRRKTRDWPAALATPIPPMLRQGAQISVIVLSRIAAAYRVSDITTIRRIMRQQVGLMMVISAPLFAVTLGFPEWVLGLFGPDFVGGATALRILSLGQLVNILAGPVGVVLLMTGNERQSLYVSVISLAMLALCCVTLIPRYGLTGAALTTALIIAMRTIISFVMVRRLLRRK